MSEQNTNTGGADAAANSQNGVIWEYQKNGVFEPITDQRIEGFYQEWLRTGREIGIVYHCFGDGLTTGVRFGEMSTFCLSHHVCEKVSHNKFPIRRLHGQRNSPELNGRPFSHWCNLL